MRGRLAIMLVAAATIVAGAVVTGRPLAAHAAGYTVITNGDSAPGTCATLFVGTLRDCINAANGAGGTNTITFNSSVTSPIVLGGTELHITGSQNLTITGLGEATTVIDGNAASRVLETDSGTTVTLTGLTIRNGHTANNSSFDGGGGVKDAGTLTLDHVTLSDNTATQGSSPQATSGGLFHTNGGTLTISHSTFSGNTVSSISDAAGGAIQDCCNGASLDVITDTLFSGNTATVTTGGSFGGAIDSHGTVRLTRATFNDNTSTQTDTSSGGSTGGAAINTHGPLTIDHSVFHHNTATASHGNAGGAVQICCPDSGSPVLTVTNSTFDHNGATGSNNASAGAIAVCCNTSASIATSTFDGNTVNGPGANGGAIQVDTSVRGATPIPIVNNTFTNNSATGGDSNGGAISLPDDEGTRTAVALTNDTIDKNSASAGANVSVGVNQTLNVLNTIISGSPATNCLVTQGGTVTDLGHNLDDGSPSTCNFLASGNGNHLGVDPSLGALGANGGPTNTQALLGGSPAIDTASNTGCPATDQRGVTRPQNATCDIGAFEVVPATPGLPSAGAGNLPMTGTADPGGLFAWLGLLAAAVISGGVGGLGRRARGDDRG